MTRKTTLLSIRIDAELVKQLDIFVSYINSNRSKVIEDAIEEHLKNKIQGLTPEETQKKAKEIVDQIESLRRSFGHK
jgi:metal-responsive CopG/Arc/MetJ family transcriptional regulator